MCSHRENSSASRVVAQGHAKHCAERLWLDLSLSRGGLTWSPTAHVNLNLLLAWPTAQDAQNDHPSKAAAERDDWRRTLAATSQGGSD